MHQQAYPVDQRVVNSGAQQVVCTYGNTWTIVPLASGSVPLCSVSCVHLWQLTCLLLAAACCCHCCCRCCCHSAGVLAYNQDAARQRIVNWLDGHKASAAAFDFVTKGVLQYAVDKCEYWRLADEQNKPSGLLGWWPSKSVVSICCSLQLPATQINLEGVGPL